jgi:hypothetical protein
LTSDTYAVPAVETVLDPVTQAAQLLVRKSNDTAHALLTITVKDETGFQTVRNGITATHPSGSAREAWKTSSGFTNQNPKLSSMSWNKGSVIVNWKRKQKS